MMTNISLSLLNISKFIFFLPTEHLEQLTRFTWEIIVNVSYIYSVFKAV